MKHLKLTAAALAAIVASAIVPYALAQNGQSTARSTDPTKPLGFFVTSEGLGKGGNLGGLAGADAHCQKLATAAGAGNGATYRMIPIIFDRRGAVGEAGEVRESVSTARKSAAALGLLSAVGAYGSFLIPQVLNASNSATGSYDNAFYGFVAGYVLMLAVTWFFYLRRSSTVGKV